MKTKQLLIFWLVLVVGITTETLAQKGTVASGGDATGTGGNVSYSIGQIDYITATGSGGTSNKGLQQPYEIYVATGVDVNAITLNFVVYPNPAVDNVILRISGGEYRKVKFSLMSLEGKLIRDEEITSENTLIPLEKLAQGLYILKVYNENKIIKVFNIIKN